MEELEAVQIAKYVITECVKKNTPVSNLHLQKILYYIQVACLKKLNKPCFNDPIEARMFGPVVRNVYRQYSCFGSMPIDWNYDKKDIPDLDTAIKDIIDTVIEQTSSKDPWDLVKDTHKKGKAWSEIYDGGKGNYEVIPIGLLRNNG